MRYQERIYVQNDNRGVRNKDILNVNMSSDFCVFQSPTFDVIGGGKIECNSIVSVLSGYSFTNMLTAATYSCFTVQSGSSSCYVQTNWETVIYADNSPVYSDVFFTTTLSGSTPANSAFISSVAQGYSALGYGYTQSGNTFVINKPYGVNNIAIDICIQFDFEPESFSCPVGYSATPANDACQQIIITGTTFKGAGDPIISGNTNGAYGNYGAFFYPNIIGDNALPVYYVGNNSNMLDQTGGTITALNINNTSPFWGNPSLTTTAGRLNNVGLSAASSEYVGFAKCFDAPTTGVYYVGIASDNNSKFLVNGVMIADFSGSVSDNFKKWSVFPILLNSGKNIIEMYGENDPTTSSSFGAEIYKPIDYPTLTGATGTGLTQANVVFTTQEYVGKTWDLGTTVGYYCPVGYSFDTCQVPYTCTKISTTAITVNCSGTCSGDCTTISNETFSGISTSDDNVYVVDTSIISTIPITFNFTGNTAAFTANNASFKYEIYKYDSNTNIFTVPPVYKSSIISYSEFSNSNILTQYIPIDSLSLDGDYLIKGYYEASVCTDFLRRLGKTIDTSIYNKGQAYQLYEPQLDYFFVAITQADIPQFNQTSTVNLPINGTLPLYQEVIFVNDSAPSGYTRTGSTFTLDSEFVGDILVTLNGLVLADNINYTLNGTALSFSGSIISGDVITIVYTRTSALTIVGETTVITSIIPSGATGSQSGSTYFYNTTTGKYEIYTQNAILAGTNIMLILNSITLLYNIDYYQSISNSNRIILNGTIMSGDIFTIIYFPVANVINGITQNNNSIAWHVQNEPQTNDGTFYLQYSTDNSFSAYSISDTVQYQPLVTNYAGNLSLTGTVGQQYFYRVENLKSFPSICGNLIQSTAYSETVRVIIQSNSINSY